ncbi:hypothetical protein [Streptomyces sp. DH8]|uniref:hypothetical protein n=1 Tax=Streptomyces sp. DH8 TaxID=2857008 RepID=UPI001E647C76|nr:hypothetical protein [Streptomyces sp. DH8]
MTTLPSSVGSGRRRLAAPAPEESVPQPGAPAQPLPRATGASPMGSPVDPPIYSALLSQWESAGRTVPGRRDAEWNQAAALPSWSEGPPRFSAFRDLRGGAR